MLPETLLEKIRFELASLEREIKETGSLFEKLSSARPDQIEIRAAAASLHTFYNGIENIFSAIARELDGRVPEGDRWHNAFLRNMCEMRKQVISPELRNSLEQYLAFRHFFRHSYGFVLDWEQLRPLCVNRMDTYRLLVKDLGRFMSME